MRRDLAVSERLYGALLHLYPKAFRAAFGRQMRLTFRDTCRAAYRRNGAGGLLALWLPTLLDLVKSALEERMRHGEIVMRSRLIALAGPLTIVVGALWVAASVGDFAFQTGLAQNEALLALVAIPFLFSFLPLLFALIGACLRFYRSAGTLGRFGLALSVAGCAGVIVFLLASMGSGEAAADGERPWVNYAAVGCVLSVRIGYILFGIDALINRPLPRGNVLPLLVGSTILLSLPLEWFGVPAVLPSQWATPFLHFASTGAFWVLLGLAMIEQRQEPQSTAAA